jgi:hypothetical protein
MIELLQSVPVATHLAAACVRMCPDRSYVEVHHWKEIPQLPAYACSSQLSQESASIFDASFFQGNGLIKRIGVN